ncbi:hypothetical protein [Algibacter mikhailovii]|uniref:hypothetical protein n=1 Tax=Algibacter mikhailovii TaxID=425498 RepID=UPI002493E338|nr:hypothetical protein [Algibacter mikhailovii]
MKNVITNTKKGFLMVTMFATLLSFANEAPFYFIKNNAKRTSISLNNVKEGNLLSIKDTNGVVLFKELIQKSGIYTKGFDLTTLPDGQYLFELEKDVEIKTIPFSVKSAEVIFNKTAETTVFKPYLRAEKDMLYVNMLALNQEPLIVEIYFTDNSNYKLMHTEKIMDKQTIHKAFKLSGLHKGSYKVICYTHGKKFAKTFN